MDFNRKRIAELRNFRLDVNNILQSYNVKTQKKTIIENLLDKQDLQFIETLIQAEQELCNSMDGLFDMSSNK